MHVVERECQPCRGIGKRLHDPRRDVGGMVPAGPFRCPDCNGTGKVVPSDSYQGAVTAAYERGFSDAIEAVKDATLTVVMPEDFMDRAAHLHPERGQSDHA